jgi:hypothetical protein
LERFPPLDFGLDCGSLAECGGCLAAGCAWCTDIASCVADGSGACSSMSTHLGQLTGTSCPGAGGGRDGPAKAPSEGKRARKKRRASKADGDGARPSAGALQVVPWREEAGASGGGGSGAFDAGALEWAPRRARLPPVNESSQLSLGNLLGDR